MVPQNSLAAMHLQTMSNAGPSVTKHIKLNMCNPIFAESICNGTPRGCPIWYLSATSEKTQNSLLHLGVAKDWGLPQEILAATATNPRVYLLIIYFATCEKTNSLQIGRCWRRLRDKLLHLFQNWTQYSSFSSCKSNFFLRLFLSGCSRFLMQYTQFQVVCVSH
jgi:hypothetical protein